MEGELPFLFLGDLPNPGIKFTSPAWQEDSLINKIWQKKKKKDPCASPEPQTESMSDISIHSLGIMPRHYVNTQAIQLYNEGYTGPPPLPP